MSFQKNVFSYSIWMIYIMCNCVAFTFLSMLFANMIPVPAPVAALGLTAAFFGILFLIYFLTGYFCRKYSGKSKASGKETVVKKQLIWEGIVVILIFALGAGLRIYLLPGAGETAAYFDVAKVSDGTPLMVTVQNSVYYYLCLLRGLFMVVGNHWAAGIWLQIVLQLAAGIVLYFTVRKMAGIIAALIVLFYMTFSPASLLAGLNYSPQMLYLLLWSIGMLFVMLYLSSSSKSQEKEKVTYSVYMWLMAVLLGVIIGFLAYVDVSGAVLLLPVLFLPMVNRIYHKKGRWIGRMLLVLVSSFGGFFGFIGLDGYLSGAGFSGVLDAWLQTFQPEVPDIIGILQNSSPEVMVLLIAMAVGVFSFCRRKDSDILAVWIFMLFGMAAIYVMGITASNMSGRALILILMSVVAAVSIRELFQTGLKKEIKQEEAQLNIIDMDASESGEGKIRFLENPLPLPKKRMKKAMEFAFMPENTKMKYDLEVSETDDFDV